LFEPSPLWSAVQRESAHGISLFCAGRYNGCGTCNNHQVHKIKEHVKILHFQANLQIKMKIKFSLNWRSQLVHVGCLESKLISIPGVKPIGKVGIIQRQVKFKPEACCFKKKDLDLEQHVSLQCSFSVHSETNTMIKQANTVDPSNQD